MKEQRVNCTFRKFVLIFIKKINFDAEFVYYRLISKRPILNFVQMIIDVAENHAKLNHVLLNVDYRNYTSIYPSSVNDWIQ